jgi:hypothetical protein
MVGLRTLCLKSDRLKTKKKKRSQEVVLIFNPSTQEAEASGVLSLKAGLQSEFQFGEVYTEKPS